MHSKLHSFAYCFTPTKAKGNCFKTLRLRSGFWEDEKESSQMDA